MNSIVGQYKFLEQVRAHDHDINRSLNIQNHVHNMARFLRSPSRECRPGLLDHLKNNNTWPWNLLIDQECEKIMKQMQSNGNEKVKCRRTTKRKNL